MVPGTNCAVLLGAKEGTRPEALAKGEPFKRVHLGRAILGQPIVVEGQGAVGSLVASFGEEPGPVAEGLVALTASSIARLAGPAHGSTLGETHRLWLAEIIHHIPAAVAVLDSKTGRIAMVNRHAEELFGMKLAEAGDVAGDTNAGFNPRWPDGRPVSPEESPVPRALRTGRAVSGVELVIDVAQGRPAHVLLSAVPILEHGVPAALVVTLVDVTERERILAAEREARASAEVTAKVRDRMVAALGHDLRQPLTAVLLGLDAVGTAQLSGPTRDTLRKTRRSARRIEAMISDLIDFAGSSTGATLKLVPREADLLGIAESVVEELQVVEPGLKVELQARGDVRGLWDEGRLEQLMTNLLVNAARYGAEGKPVEVRLEGRGGEVVAEVRNRGEPIPAEVQPQLFQPFVRATRKGPGMGLGLFIVREIARAHGGSAALATSDASGTTFCIRLPRGAGASG
ncbi:MAG: ATP-binding protein [Myxococcales bacterium]